MLIGSLRSVLLVWYLSFVLYLGLVSSPPGSGLACFPGVGDGWLHMASGHISSVCLMGLIGIDGIIHNN